MKLLVVDSLAQPGHKHFNHVVLQALSQLGDVTLATLASAHKHCTAIHRLLIPDGMRRGRSKIATQWDQVRILRKILAEAAPNSFDLTLALCYDTISFCAVWPRAYPLVLFEHNNLDAVDNSLIKTAAYALLPRRAVHISLLNYISKRITAQYGRRAASISYPCIATPSSTLASCRNKRASEVVIFAPSGGNTEAGIEELKSLANDGHRFYVIAKGRRQERGERFVVQPYFDNYEELLTTCDCVFVDGSYHYRISAVMFDALSVGKPVFARDCLMAREVSRLYPCSVHPVRDVSEIKDWRIDHQGIQSECETYRREGSLDAIRTSLGGIVREALQPTLPSTTRSRLLNPTRVSCRTR